MNHWAGLTFIADFLEAPYKVASSFLIREFTQRRRRRHLERQKQGRIQDFFWRGCTRLLLFFNTNKPHSSFFFFLQNTSCIRKPQVISGRGAHPLHPPPGSAPEKSNRFRLAKQQLYTCITLFCTFLFRRCTTTT